MAETSIEWTDATWNPVAGCTVLTAGCTNCYAMRMAARLDAMGQRKYKGLTRRSGERWVWTGKIRLDAKSIETPKSWSKPRKVFVNSMSDLFHDDVPIHFIAKVWATMRDTQRHTYQRVKSWGGMTQPIRPAMVGPPTRRDLRKSDSQKRPSSP
jgi:protein gp37